MLLRVLAVDDAEPAIELLREALAKVRPGAEVRSAGNGEEAIAVVQAGLLEQPRWMPDVAFLDLSMPRMDGFQLVKALRGTTFLALPIVVLSGSLVPQDRQRALALGATAYATKPDTFEDLVALLIRWRQEKVIP